MFNTRMIWLYCLMLIACTGFSQVEKSDAPNGSSRPMGFNFECVDDCPILEFSNVSNALSKDRTTIGIGEEVDLKIEGNHDGWCGFVQWSVSDENLGLLNTNVGVENRLNARMQEGVITVTAELLNPGANCSTAECQVVFTQSFTIIKPTEIFFQFAVDPPDDCPEGDIRHRNDYVSTGYWGQYFLLPDNVSFYNLMVGEKEVLATADGYFSDYNGLNHNPGPLVTAADVVVAGKGTFIVGSDNIWIQGWASGDSQHPLSSGSFLWPIPWKAQHMNTLEEADLFIVNQEVNSNSAGLCTLTKDLTVQSNIDDPTNCPN